jgi:hypothetical protein
MAAVFLTKDQLKEQRARTIENAANGVADYYSELGPTFGRALFFASMRTWGAGPVVTLARLNNNVRPQIIDAWQYRDDITGVLLKKHGFEFTPIYLQTPSLAFKLMDRADLWIDFKEIKKELGQ